MHEMNLRQRVANFSGTATVEPDPHRGIAGASGRHAARAADVPFLRALTSGDYSRAHLREALLCRDGEQVLLYELARVRREAAFPAREVEVRSVIELSNVCRQSCNYCSMAKEVKLDRYVIKRELVLQLVDFLHAKGRRVVLFQSGENNSRGFVEYVAGCVAEIKRRHPDLEIILCLGNLSYEQYARLKEAGADRYILKFESANPALYSRWKPSDTLEQRLECLQDLVDVGYKVGTGNMVGMPGQQVEDMVEDLLLLGRYKLAMMSCTVFIPGEACNYADQPTGDVELALNSMALMRILYPDRLMPTTSCLEKAKPHGQMLGLMAGANTVTIHDGTPEEYKRLFPIYSTHRCTPNTGHIENIVQEAHLRPGTKPLI